MDDRQIEKVGKIGALLVEALGMYVHNDSILNMPYTEQAFYDKADEIRRVAALIPWT